MRMVGVRAGQPAMHDRPRTADLDQGMVRPLVPADLGQNRLALFKCHRSTFLASDEPRPEAVSYWTSGDSPRGGRAILPRLRRGHAVWFAAAGPFWKSDKMGQDRHRSLVTIRVDPAAL